MMFRLDKMVGEMVSSQVVCNVYMTPVLCRVGYALWGCGVGYLRQDVCKSKNE